MMGLKLLGDRGPSFFPHGSDLKQCPEGQPADGAVVGLVAQGVCAGVAEAEVPAGQDQSIADVRETHHTLSAVVTDVVLCHLGILCVVLVFNPIDLL